MALAGSLLLTGLAAIVPTATAHSGCQEGLVTINLGGHDDQSNEPAHVCVDPAFIIETMAVSPHTHEIPSAPAPGTPPEGNCLPPPADNVCHPTVTGLRDWATTYASEALFWLANVTEVPHLHNADVTLIDEQDTHASVNGDNIRDEVCEIWGNNCPVPSPGTITVPGGSFEKAYPGVDGDGDPGVAVDIDGTLWWFPSDGS